ncbi:hypothetical protein JCGZ_12841 [Jatropha curcas]|uniref:Aminotransferase-like plant mobile domain-containing protein n=1 Tax=Jatropha curcas TaxID=180498 RepID=A0A067KDV7_JATCU|nr:hypothetical protein JCGZ_12841 [Jatropha curcas]
MRSFPFYFAYEWQNHPSVHTHSNLFLEKGVRHGKSSGNTFATRECFDRFPKRVQECLRVVGFGCFVDTILQVQGQTLPSSILVLMEQWMDTTHTFRLSFDEMTITLVDFATIMGLLFGGRFMVFDDRMRTLDCPGLRVSLRAAIGMEPTIFDQRVRYESIYAHYQEMPRKRVAEMDVDVVARVYLFYLLSTTLFTNHGNDTDLVLLPSL